MLALRDPFLGPVCLKATPEKALGLPRRPIRLTWIARAMPCSVMLCIATHMDDQPHSKGCLIAEQDVRLQGKIRKFGYLFDMRVHED